MIFRYRAGMKELSVASQGDRNKERRSKGMKL